MQGLNFVCFLSQVEHGCRGTNEPVSWGSASVGLVSPEVASQAFST